MGHMVGKDVYRKLGKKVDNLKMRAPWNETFHAILKELYSLEEADVVVKMPYGLSNLDRIEKVTKYERSKLQKILENLSDKGLVMDLWMRDEYHYMPSPLLIGIFEFTMMRTGEGLNTKEWAKLFHAYMLEDDTFYAANLKHKERVSPLRALPHEDAIDFSEHVEVLDYEKATTIIKGSNRFSIVELLPVRVVYPELLLFINDCGSVYVNLSGLALPAFPPEPGLVTGAVTEELFE